MSTNAENAVPTEDLERVRREWDALWDEWRAWEALVNKDEPKGRFFKTLPESYVADYHEFVRESDALEKKPLPKGAFDTAKYFKRINTITDDEIRLDRYQDALKKYSDNLESLKQKLREKSFPKYNDLKKTADSYQVDLTELVQRLPKNESTQVMDYKEQLLLTQEGLDRLLSDLNSAETCLKAKTDGNEVRRLESQLEGLRQTLQKLSDKLSELNARPKAPLIRAPQPPVVTTVPAKKTATNSIAALLESSRLAVLSSKENSETKEQYQECQDELDWASSKISSFFVFCGEQPESELRDRALECLSTHKATLKSLRDELATKLKTPFNEEEQKTFSGITKAFVETLKSQFTSEYCVPLAVFKCNQELQALVAEGAECNALIEKLNNTPTIATWNFIKERCDFDSSFQEERDQFHKAFTEATKQDAWMRKVEACKKMSAESLASWTALTDAWMTWSALIPLASPMSWRDKITFSKSPDELHKAFQEQDVHIKKSFEEYDQDLKSTDPVPLNDSFKTQFLKKHQEHQKGLEEFKQYFIDVCTAQYDKVEQERAQLSEQFKGFNTTLKESTLSVLADEIEAFRIKLDVLQVPIKPYLSAIPGHRDHRDNIQIALADGRERLLVAEKCRGLLADLTARFKEHKETARKARLEEEKDVQSRLNGHVMKLREYREPSDETQALLKEVENKKLGVLSEKVRDWVVISPDVTTQELEELRDLLKRVTQQIDVEEQRIIKSHSILRSQSSNHEGDGEEMKKTTTKKKKKKKGVVPLESPVKSTHVPLETAKQSDLMPPLPTTPAVESVLATSIKAWSVLAQNWDDWMCLLEYVNDVQKFGDSLRANPQALFTQFTKVRETVVTLATPTKTEKVVDYFTPSALKATELSDDERHAAQYQDAHKSQEAALEDYKQYFITRCKDQFESLRKRVEESKKSIQNLDTRTFEEQKKSLKRDLDDFKAKTPELRTLEQIKAGLEQLRSLKSQVDGYDDRLKSLTSLCEERDKENRAQLEARRKNLTTTLEEKKKELNKLLPATKQILKEIGDAMPITDRSLTWDADAVAAQCKKYEGLIQRADDDFIILAKRLTAYQGQYQACQSQLGVVQKWMAKFDKFFILDSHKKSLAFTTYEQHKATFVGYQEKWKLFSRTDTLTLQDETDLAELIKSVASMPATLNEFGIRECFSVAKNVNQPRFTALRDLISNLRAYDLERSEEWKRSLELLEQSPKWDAEKVICVFEQGFHEKLDKWDLDWLKDYNEIKNKADNLEHTRPILDVELEDVIEVNSDKREKSTGTDPHFITAAELQTELTRLVDEFEVEKKVAEQEIIRADSTKKKSICDTRLLEIQKMKIPVERQSILCQRYNQRHMNHGHPKFLALIQKIDAEILRLARRKDAGCTISEMTKPENLVADFGDERVNKLLELRQELGKKQKEFIAQEEEPKDGEFEQQILGVLKPYAEPEKLEEFASPKKRGALKQFIRSIVHWFQEKRYEKKNKDVNRYWLGWMTPAASAKNVQQIMLEALNDPDLNFSLRNDG